MGCHELPGHFSLLKGPKIGNKMKMYEKFRVDSTLWYTLVYPTKVKIFEAEIPTLSAAC